MPSAASSSGAERLGLEFRVGGPDPNQEPLVRVASLFRRKPGALRASGWRESKDVSQESAM